jgi:cysteine desulfurase
LQLGASVTYLPVDRTGLVDPEALRAAITPHTILVTIMHANNEVGTIQPVAEISRIARQHGVLVHTDAAQSVGKIPVKVEELGIDLLTIAGHKLYAPKGVGALYVRRGVVLEPLIHGGGHERGRRAGTESVLMAAALGAACSLAAAQDSQAVARLRDRLWAGLRAAFGEHVVLNGHPTRRLPNTLNVSFVGRVGADILSRLPSVAASTGSACHFGQIKLSPVLAAMGVSEQVGMGAIRFSLGRGTTEAEIDAVIDGLRRAVSPPFQESAEATLRQA